MNKWKRKKWYKSTYDKCKGTENTIALLLADFNLKDILKVTESNMMDIVELLIKLQDKLFKLLKTYESIVSEIK